MYEGPCAMRSHAYSAFRLVGEARHRGGSRLSRSWAPKPNRIPSLFRETTWRPSNPVEGIGPSVPRGPS